MKINLKSGNPICYNRRMEIPPSGANNLNASPVEITATNKALIAEWFYDLIVSKPTWRATIEEDFFKADRDAIIGWLGIHTVKGVAGFDAYIASDEYRKSLEGVLASLEINPSE